MTITDTTFNSVDEIVQFGLLLDASGPFVVVGATQTGSGRHIWIFQLINGVLTEVVTKQLLTSTSRLVSLACYYDPKTEILHIITGYYWEGTYGVIRFLTYQSGDPWATVVKTYESPGTGGGGGYGWKVGIDRRTGRYAYASMEYLGYRGMDIWAKDDQENWDIDYYVPTTQVPGGSQRAEFWTTDSGTVYLAMPEANSQHSDAYPPGTVYKCSPQTLYLVSDEDQGGAPPPYPRPGSAYIVNNWGVGYTQGDLWEWRGDAIGWVFLKAGNGTDPTQEWMVVTTKEEAKGTFAGMEGYLVKFTYYPSRWEYFLPPEDAWLVTLPYGALTYLKSAHYIYSAAHARWENYGCNGQGNVHLLKRNGYNDWPTIQRLGQMGATVSFGQVIPNKTIMVTMHTSYFAWRTACIWELTDAAENPLVYEEICPLAEEAGIWSGWDKYTYQVGYRVLLASNWAADSQAGCIHVATCLEDGTFLPILQQHLLQQTGHADNDHLGSQAGQCMSMVYAEGGYIRVYVGVPDDPGTVQGSFVEFNGDVDFPALPSGQEEGWPPAPPSLDSVDPDILPDIGGVIMTITGEFPVRTDLAVHLGALGTKEDPPCYGGEGYGYMAWSLDGITLTAVSPPIDPGSYKLSVWDGDSTLGSLDVTVVEFYWPGKRSGRKSFPPWFEAGVRQLSEDN